jgi:histidyl-tRNA synthetase
MRILDSKDPRDRPAADSAPDIDQFLTDKARDFFQAVTSGLDAAAVAWTRNARLVRGLDYYRHTAFEFVTDRLGAQGTVLAGGRYDGLIEALGGPHTPAIGWAAGIERLAMMIDAPIGTGAEIAVVPDKPELEGEAAALAVLLRRAGVASDFAFRGNSKKRIENARKKGIGAVLILRGADADPRLHLTSYGGSVERQKGLQERIFMAVRDSYGGLSGGPNG